MSKYLFRLKDENKELMHEELCDSIEEAIEVLKRENSSTSMKGEYYNQAVGCTYTIQIATPRQIKIIQNQDKELSDDSDRRIIALINKY